MPMLEGMSCQELLTLAGNALAVASQKCVDEYAGAGDAAARVQQLTEEAAGAVGQALQEIGNMQPAGGEGGAPGAPAAPEAPKAAPPQG